jgi:hypothetical protein
MRDEQNKAGICKTVGDDDPTRGATIGTAIGVGFAALYTTLRTE